MNSCKRSFFAVLVVLLLLSAMELTAITIKVASLVPDGSPWHRALLQIAADWRKISNGRVSVKIYPGGVAGDETDAIRKMRINQIQAALVTGKGLAYINTDFFVFQLPFVVRSDDELDYLFARLKPELENLLEQKGFTLLSLSKSGWLHFFTTKEAETPEQMMKLKMFSLEGHASVDQALKEMGFQIVPLKANDVFAALQGGMVEAFAAAPLVAASMQWFALAPNMTNFNWTPLTGALIISSRAWRMIPTDLHQRLLASAETIIEELYPETMDVEKQAIEIMKENGLVIHPVSRETLEQWRELVSRGLSKLIGDTISPDIYEKTIAILEEYRNH